MQPWQTPLSNSDPLPLDSTSAQCYVTFCAAICRSGEGYYIRFSIMPLLHKVLQIPTLLMPLRVFSKSTKIRRCRNLNPRPASQWSERCKYGQHGSIDKADTFQQNLSYCLSDGIIHIYIYGCHLSLCTTFQDYPICAPQDYPGHPHCFHIILWQVPWGNPLVGHLVRVNSTA